MLFRNNKMLDITLMGRKEHDDSIRKNGLYMDCVSFKEYIHVKVDYDLDRLLTSSFTFNNSLLVLSILFQMQKLFYLQ